MWKYIVSIIVLAFLITVNVPALITEHDNPCVYQVCPDYGGGGEGLFKYVVDSTPPNFYLPPGTYCGFACIEYGPRIIWPLFAFDLIVWLIITFIIFRFWRES